MKTWHTITVGEWMQCTEILSQKLDDLEEEIAISAIIAGKSQADIEAMAWGEYTELKKQIRWIHEKPPESMPMFRWGNYRFIYDVRQINTGRYISIQYFLNNGIEKNLHNLAACIIRPRWFKKYDAGKHEQYANDLKDAPLTAILGSMVFFCNLFLNLTQAILKEVENQTGEKTTETLILLKKHLDGLYTANASQLTSV